MNHYDINLGNIKFDLSDMPYSRRQRSLYSSPAIEEEEKKTFNLMNMESQSIRGWWKVYYTSKHTSQKIESVR